MVAPAQGWRADDPAFAIIIPTHHRPDRIAACLESICSVDTSVPFEVFVVDDASGDATDELLERWGVPHLIRQHNGGAGPARNNGVAATSAPIIAFMDDDQLVPQGFFEQLAATWASVGDEVQAVGCRIAPRNPQSFNQRFVSWQNPFQPSPAELGERPRMWKRVTRYLRTINGSLPSSFEAEAVGAGTLSVRRAAWDRVGGFIETVTTSGEDDAFCLHLRETYGGAALRFEGDLFFLQDFDRRFRDSTNRYYRYGWGAGRLWRCGELHLIIPPLPGVSGLVLLATLPFLGPWALAASLAVPYLLCTVGMVRNLRLLRDLLVFPAALLLLESINWFGFLRGALASKPGE